MPQTMTRARRPALPGPATSAAARELAAFRDLLVDLRDLLDDRTLSASTRVAGAAWEASQLIAAHDAAADRIMALID